MSYRRTINERDWLKWRRKNHDLITSSGLPEVFFESKEQWLNFLEHGYYEFFPSVENPFSWFDLDDLNTEQRLALKALIEDSPHCDQTLVARWLNKKLHL